VSGRSAYNGNGQSNGQGQSVNNGPDVTQRDWQLALARSGQSHWWQRV
jgi:hypothetical protein